MTEAPAGTVYFVERDGLIKIGWTTNIARRLRELGRGAQAIAGQRVGPVTRLAAHRGDRAVESALHRQFAQLRVGGEWFRYEGALRRHVEQLVACEATYWQAVLHPETAPCASCFRGHRGSCA